LQAVDGIRDRNVTGVQTCALPISDVGLTNDLQHATVYVSVLGDEEEKEASIKGLNKAKGFVRSEIGNRIRLRKTPEVVFEFDEAHEHGNRIEKILKDLD